MDKTTPLARRSNNSWTPAIGDSVTWSHPMFPRMLPLPGRIVADVAVGMAFETDWDAVRADGRNVEKIMRNFESAGLEPDGILLIDGRAVVVPA